MTKVPEGLAIEILNKVAAAQKEALNKALRQGCVLYPANYDFMGEYLCEYKLTCWCLVLFAATRIYPGSLHSLLTASSSGST